MKQAVLATVFALLYNGMSFGQIVCPEKCDLSKCTPFESDQCSAGTVQEECDCCPKCAQGEGEICDLPDAPDPRGSSGQCGDNLDCVQRTDIDENIQEGVCRCVMPGSVCGTDGVTYNNFCQLRRVTPAIKVEHRGRCQSKAEITNRLENVDVKEGDKVVLVCEVTGNPQPLIWWEFRGIEHDPTALPGDDPHISTSTRGGSLPYTIISWLQIQKAAEAHEGDYSCITNNRRGDDSQTARIKVIRASEQLL